MAAWREFKAVTAVAELASPPMIWWHRGAKLVVNMPPPLPPEALELAREQVARTLRPAALGTRAP